MEIKHIRTKQGFESTLSGILIDGKSYGNLLEDEDRGLTSQMSLEQIKKLKVYGRTAIPSGRYPVKMTYSPHFKMELPEIDQIPGYDLVYIHWGNLVTHTLGCPLIGTKPDQDKQGYWRVWNSKVTFDPFLQAVKRAFAMNQKVWYEVTRTYDVKKK